MDLNAFCTYISEISLRVILQIIRNTEPTKHNRKNVSKQKSNTKIIQEYICEGRTHLLQRQCSPEGSLPAQQVVLIDDARDGSALADARTVPDQIGCSVLVGQEGLVLLRTRYMQEESVQQT